MGRRIAEAREGGASAGPFNWAGEPVLPHNCNDRRAVRPWEADEVVDPAGARERAVERRLRRYAA